MKHIPVHKLKERVNIGFEIRRANAKSFQAKDSPLEAHRDDHYIFFTMEQGLVSILIDFTEVTLPAGSAYYILPGQVHRGLNYSNASGWFIAVDTLLVPKEVRKIFEERLLLQQPHILNETHLQQCKILLTLLCNQYDSNAADAFYKQQVYALLNNFLYIVADGFSLPGTAKQSQPRTLQIAHQFRHLLATNFTTVKQPSAYAELLNITETYLNEALKKTTGFSVTYWILNEAMLEAKRLLYYSELNVKEIAHQLGYEDHTYFSRLFKKSTQMTPLEFRKTYRK